MTQLIPYRNRILTLQTIQEAFKSHKNQNSIDTAIRLKLEIGTFKLGLFCHFLVERRVQIKTLHHEVYQNFRIVIFHFHINWRVGLLGFSSIFVSFALF